MKTYELDKGWSNWAKLAAALLVAVSHYSTVIVINNHWSDSAFLRFWCQGGYIGVALFFFFSGYGLMESDKKNHLELMPFIKKRFLKVYLPVLMVSVFWIPIYYAFVSKEPFVMSLSAVGAFVYDVFWGFRDCVLWFVKILFIMYGVFYAFTWLRKKGYNGASHALLIGGAVIATWFASYQGYPFISVPLFGIGVYSSLYKDKQIAKMPISIVLMVAMAVVCAVCYLLTKSADPAHGVVNCFVAITTVAGIYMLNKITPPPFVKCLCISNLYNIYSTL